MQTSVISNDRWRGLDPHERILPEFLNALGYASHAVGKWHLGFCRRAFAPTRRGFSSHFGYWGRTRTTSAIGWKRIAALCSTHDNNNYFAFLQNMTMTGWDMREDLKPAANETAGKYSKTLFTDRAVEIIRGHRGETRPLFLYFAHLAPHIGGTSGEPLQAPEDIVAHFSYIQDPKRRIYAGMLNLLDQSVGRIVSALQENEMLENSVLVFTSDNGGVGDVEGSRGNNFPLRGMKGTLFEAGVRAVGAIWSPLIEKPQRVFQGLMHISDWLPTIYHLAGGNMSDLPPQLDGLNMWPSLSRDEPSLRKEVLLNIDPTTSSKALMAGMYKTVSGTRATRADLINSTRLAFMPPDCSMLYVCVVFLAIASLVDSARVQPHAVVIVADDLGWRDVGFHGSSSIPTPNIDSLAYSGVILHNYYVQPLHAVEGCPPHGPITSYVITNPRCWGLDPLERILPEYLNALGYASHAVGKWHLGFCRRAFAPTRRGFASHFGYWGSHQDYFSHQMEEECSTLYMTMTGWDMREDLKPVANETAGKYSTTLFTDRAVEIIQGHRGERRPLFLYLAHLAPHVGGTSGEPLQAPEDIVARFSYIQDPKRRIYAGMLTLLDQSVGRIVSALQESEMLENSVLVFTSDNGGVGDVEGSRGNNFPLRGMKGTLFEGGVRAVGTIWSPLIEKPQRVFQGLMHISDWLPTIYHLAGNNLSILCLNLKNSIAIRSSTGGNVSDLPPQLDGLNMWPSLSRGEPSLRGEVLLNIDPITGSKALRAGKYKIITGPRVVRDVELYGWYGDPGALNLNETTQPLYEGTLEYLKENDFTGATLGDLGYLPSEEKQEMLRKEAAVTCLRDETNPTACDPSQVPCVFDLSVDPCEQMNLVELCPKAESERNGHFWPPDLLGFLESRLLSYEESKVPPLILNVSEDPNADPSLWHGMWTYWLDNDIP
ncbi:unnamed protein product [Darwinula stevensoni]|uniref:Sulfatase N-terminal domain-containing protein n=1 Tax=Darwinula stevensoni TaxID=69355 RepID=A0A7R8XIY1_9CRUS|nr:unnamed protein product [Darwinula stevensoni]CAG0894732.1 unnamed protein product [Darwinula stevensoni]